MFAKPYQSRNVVYYLFKRNYNLKKLTVQMQKNPHIKNIFEQETNKRQSGGVFKKLVDKR